jgi:hypothetical protein
MAKYCYELHGIQQYSFVYWGYELRKYENPNLSCVRLAPGSTVQLMLTVSDTRNDFTAMR